MWHKKNFVGLILISCLMILSGCSTFAIDENDQVLLGETHTPMVDVLSVTSPVETSQLERTPLPTITPTFTPMMAKKTQSIEETPTTSLSDLTDYIYQVQSGSPAYLPNLFHPELGCNWLGIGGQVFDEGGNPIKQDIVVEAGGVLEDRFIIGISLTGLAPDYGEGGYEIVLTDHGVDSQGTVWVQLSDLNGNKISPQIYINTYNDCAKNLVLLNFVPYYEKTLNRYYLPYIGQDDDR